MLGTVIGVVGALLGVIIGGGVRAWEAWAARRADARSLLSALAAEVEAVTRLINHRGFVPGLEQTRDNARVLVAAGRGTENAPFLTIFLSQSYFSIYDANVAKIGLLHPYYADRIVRFYTYCKAVQENYHPSSPMQEGLDANTVIEVIDNDLMLLRTAIAMGEHIASFRSPGPPKGVHDPFLNPGQEPALPSAEEPEAPVRPVRRVAPGGQ